MLSAVRNSFLSASRSRSFSTTLTRQNDLAKLVLIGHLGGAPEARFTKNNHEYVSYSVATNTYSAREGDAVNSKTTWHRILSFNEGQNKYLTTLKKGSRVYVEANFDLREPEPEADQSTPQGQRQIFLKHNTIVVLNPPKTPSADNSHVE